MRTALLAAVAVGTLLLVACGTDSTSRSDTSSTSTPKSSAIATVSTTKIGDTLVGQDGLTLYGLTTDSDGKPTCVDACANAWPPMTVDSAALPAGLDPAIFSVVKRPDNGFQLKAGKWPLYYFAGDAAAGDVNGQGSGGVWFAAAPDGSLIRADKQTTTTVDRY